jgi:hypothetical protein
MSPTNQTNGTTDDLFYPADYGAEIQLEVMRPSDREALRARLSELRALPREQWEDHGVIDLTDRLPGKYAMFFGEDGIAWVLPQPDGRFCVSGLGSQKTLRRLQRHAQEEGADEGEDDEGV